MGSRRTGISFISRPFLSSGRVIQADENTQALQQVVYLFNRETFWGDPEHWAAQVQEELFLPPALNCTSNVAWQNSVHSVRRGEISSCCTGHPLLTPAVSAIENINEAQQPFVIAYDHISHLQALFAAQAQALSIAYANLSQYILPLVSEYEDFSSHATAVLAKEERLLGGADADLAMLSKIPVHEAFERERGKRSKEKEKAGDSEDGKPARRTLADLLSVRKLQMVKKDVAAVHGES